MVIKAEGIYSPAGTRIIGSWLLTVIAESRKMLTILPKSREVNSRLEWRSFRDVAGGHRKGHRISQSFRPREGSYRDNSAVQVIQGQFTGPLWAKESAVRSMNLEGGHMEG